MAYLFQSGSMESQLSGGMDFNYSNVETDKMMAINSDAADATAAAGTLGFGADGAANDGALYWDGSTLCFATLGTKRAEFDADGLNLETGDDYSIAGASVISAGGLGTGVITSALTTLGTQSEDLEMGENNINNAGDINCDSVSVDDAAVGLDVIFGGNTGTNKMSLTDNLAIALDVTQGANSYLKFVTSDGGELVAFGKDVDIDGGAIDGTVIGANTAAAATVTTLSLTSIASNWTNAGRTVADMGILTTVDINGGNIDATAIGAATPAAAAVTTLDASGASVLASTVQFSALTADTAVVVADDGLFFNDGRDGTVKNVNIGSFCTDIAGSGLTVSANQLTLESNVVYAWTDANATLSGGVNYMTSDLGADRTLTLPRCSTDFDAGDKVTLKLLQCDGFTATIAPNAVDQIDDLAVDVALELNSDNAAITLVCVSNAAAGKWRII
jgi:hypothetical protein